jgi:predicted component of type VI protein secretion system
LATPVGSGTVARTERIPLEDRARSAVIAWMRHQTTGYDHMTIARVKGRRRQVRRELASQSTRLLQLYRDGDDIPPSCPLFRALTDEK